MKKLIAGNWKMNLNKKEVESLLSNVKDGINNTERAQYLVCAPYVYLSTAAAKIEGSNISLGAQDCALTDNGAHTGDISAEMLADIGASYVIIGHSERRSNHNEIDEMVKEKSLKAYAQGLIAIICVGETLEQREAGNAQAVVKEQLDHSIPDNATAQNTVIAYEPVWAIGTGKTASPEDVADMHSFIRGELTARFDSGAEMRILYGGSMKPANAKALLATPNVDGGLIGGASLKAEDFLAIGAAA